jgi:glycosyltransferase involved in cell wall biosynthesis
MQPLLYALLPRPPHATRDGGAIRMRHLLGALAEAFRVRAFVLKAAGAPEGDYPAGLEVIEVPHPGGARHRAAAALGSLLAGGAYSDRLYRSQGLDDRVARAVRAERPAWVLAHFYHLGMSALRSAAPAWIDFQNIDSEIWTRVGQTATSPLIRLFARAQAPRVAALERHLARAAAGVSCVSARDARALEALGPAAPPLLVPNGVDLERYRYREPPASGETVFFVGDLSWPPNAEGLRWFRSRVWPLVRQARPEAAAEILGRGAPADLARHARDRFRLLGEGGDTRPHWERATVAIVPLLAGGGTRLKILEAAACGVPVVSTPVGAEGLDLDPGAEIAIAADAASFADKVCRLLADPAERRRQAAEARRKVESLYDWEPIGRAFARELLQRSRQA